jgi:hypothetical protein
MEDAKLLQESLEVVQRTASVILGGIAPEEGAAQVPRTALDKGLERNFSERAGSNHEKNAAFGGACPRAGAIIHSRAKTEETSQGHLGSSEKRQILIPLMPPCPRSFLPLT